MKEKKICFLIEEKKFVDFKLRLRHDGFTQTSFVSLVIDAYLENQSEFQSLLEKNLDRSKLGRKRTRKTISGYKAGLSNEDLLKQIRESEDIYSIIEKEIGEL